MNAIKESMSIWRIMKITERNRSRLKSLMIQTLSKSRETLLLMLFKDFYVTRGPPTLHSDIKFFIQGVRSRAKCATPSLTMEVMRISFLEYSWTI